MFKVFIDGQEGTTGLRIYERLAEREDIEVLKIDSIKRKDLNERSRLINLSDVTFLCLPDDAAIQSVLLTTNPKTIIIDASTAHRINDSWAYGFPELGESFLDKIKNGTRVSVPGCHASGAIAIIRPLVEANILPNDYPFSIISLTGYSGGGKKMISEYESTDDKEFASPRVYGLTQEHKHLKEITKHSLLKVKPIFNPIVAPFYSGMVVSVGFHTDKKIDEIFEFYKSFYKENKFVRVIKLADEIKFIGSNNLSGKDYMEIYVYGSEDRITVMSRFDNLGKGASGAAIECMNIMLGLDSAKGLVL